MAITIDTVSAPLPSRSYVPRQRTLTADEQEFVDTVTNLTPGQSFVMDYADAVANYKKAGIKYGRLAARAGKSIKVQAASDNHVRIWVQEKKVKAETAE